MRFGLPLVAVLCCSVQMFNRKGNLFTMGPTFHLRRQIGFFALLLVEGISGRGLLQLIGISVGGGLNIGL